MRITRILDLAVIILLATVVLMPRPDVTVKPALALDSERRDRVAELQSSLIGNPTDADAALELSKIYLDGHRPDWALATVTSAVSYHAEDWRLHQLRAISFADRFEGAPAFEASQKALALCERQPAPAGAPACGEAAHARLALLNSTLEAVSKVDMRGKPYLAKERILEQMHPVFIPKPRPKGKAVDKAKSPASPAPPKAP